MSLVIPFGRKYKHRDLLEIYHINPSYCKWLYTQPFVKQYSDIYDFLKSKFYDEREIYLDFGKYNKKPLSYIVKNDMKYIYYLHSLSFVKQKKKLYDALDFIVKHITVEDYY